MHICSSNTIVTWQERELKRATSNAKKALERRANYPSSRTHLENQIMAKEEELEKLKKTVG